MDVKQEIIDTLKKVLMELGIDGVEPQIAFPSSPEHGDYTTNIALAMFANSGFKTSMELATHIVEKFKVQSSKFKVVEKIEVAPPGFINFWISKEYLISQLSKVIENIENVVPKTKSPKNIMVEYAHPNTHKEMHIGHMRTLITGEAIARLLEATGNKVFRANYQGDIGPHVAKALYGVQKIMEDENLSLKEAETWTNQKKAHFLGRGYVRGNQDYEEHKDEIDKINFGLYSKSSAMWKLYEVTRKWSLDYYDEFYTRFYTHFDRLFFESEVAECGKKIVEENVGSPRDEAGKVFDKDEGAIVFKKGFHTRVFVTKQGYPTYEGKEMCLGLKEYEAFPFDRAIHVVGSEQAGYFSVVFKALEMLDPEKFKGTQFHLSMGMVTIIGMKMSSRTGELLRVDDLVDSVRNKIEDLIKQGKINASDKEKVAEEIAIGAIKYSVLNVGVTQNVKFDIERSISLDGNSGPYLQYTYARTQSVITKAQSSKLKAQSYNSRLKTEELEPEELSLLRQIHKFSEIVTDAADKLSPNILCGYLFDLAQHFNLFYQRHSILSSDKKGFRLALTKAVGQVLKDGLYLLGIRSPERM